METYFFRYNDEFAFLRLSKSQIKLLEYLRDEMQCLDSDAEWIAISDVNEITFDNN